MLSIRTQDRMALVPYRGIYIEFIKNGYDYKKNMWFLMGSSVDTERIYILGAYTTKERALEVLDEIEKASMGKLLLPTPLVNEEHLVYAGRAIIKPQSKEKIEILPIVYQMPSV